MPQKKRCFVVMGFGIKTDYVNGRKLNLDKSYRLLVKPVVESRGLDCFRADEIPHSGNIDVKMYQELLEADLVIADLSTANPNALYELGVRHALRPFTTIVISEDKFVNPFNLNHLSISSYQHLGDAIDFEEVHRFREALGKLIDTVLGKKKTDSPVYTFLNSLVPPKVQEQIDAAIGRAKAAQTPQKASENLGVATSLLIQEAEDAIEVKEFAKAKQLFETVRTLSGDKNDSYIIHRLAFCTYKAALPDTVSSLHQSLALLNSINLAHTNDAETVSLAGAVEKKLYEVGEGNQHLENSILYYQRSYYLLNNRYNGVNLALTLLYRATSSIATNDQERIADLVFARRTWQRVLFLCERDWPIINQKEAGDLQRMQNGNKDGQELKEYYQAEKYWIQVNKAEASYGLGDFETYRIALAEAEKIPHHPWQVDSFHQQMDKLAVELKKVGHLLEPKWEAPD
ncbi:MAG: hypothetical protein NXH89_10655 [Cyclobacteriaceae bacterium]|nr:hypothetical protein [Cyclobacteriaceae bacterium]